MINPETNQIELLKKLERFGLVRPDGSPVPKTWKVFAEGELVVVKDYTFKVAYINEASITLEPVSPVLTPKEATNDNTRT